MPWLEDSDAFTFEFVRSAVRICCACVSRSRIISQILRKWAPHIRVALDHAHHMPKVSHRMCARITFTHVRPQKGDLQHRAKRARHVTCCVRVYMRMLYAFAYYVEYIMYGACTRRRAGTSELSCACVHAERCNGSQRFSRSGFCLCGYGSPNDDDGAFNLMIYRRDMREVKQTEKSPSLFRRAFVVRA